MWALRRRRQCRLAKLGALPKTGTPADFAAFIASELPKWEATVKLAGAKVD